MTSRSSVHRPARLTAAIAVAAMAGLSLACEPVGGAGGSTGTGGGSDRNAASQSQAGTGGGGGSETTPAGSPETSTVDTTEPPVDNRPVVGNVELSPQNVRCSYIPGGNLDGSDGLTVFAYVLLIGTNSLPGPLSNAMAISNGFSTNYTGHPDNQAAAVFQGPIRSSDWGSRLTVSIDADADDRYRETSESDNAIEVTMNLPSNRPSQPVDSFPCSASRA